MGAESAKDILNPSKKVSRVEEYLLNYVRAFAKNSLEILVHPVLAYGCPDGVEPLLHLVAESRLVIGGKFGGTHKSLRRDAMYSLQEPSATLNSVSS